ncbi:MAG: hypothetical protein AAF846_20935 [Chloroflexota bacterium]
MLTHEERIKSYAHKCLTKLEGYTPYTDSDVTPEILLNQSIMGQYHNADGTTVFITLTGLYLEPHEWMIPYSEMRSCDIDLTNTSKSTVQKIQIYLKTGEQIELPIIQPLTAGNGRTNEIWQVFTFLRNLIAKS